MMQIIVNGEEKTYDDNTTLEEVINTLGLGDKVMASAVNMEIVKKDKWSECILKDNDKLELLEFVGGG